MAFFYIEKLALSRNLNVWIVPSSGVVRHDEEGESTLGDVMEEILFPDICQFAIIRRYLGQYSLCGWDTFVQRQLWQWNQAEPTLWKISFSCLVFGQNRVSSSDKSMNLSNNHSTTTLKSSTAGRTYERHGGCSSIAIQHTQKGNVVPPVASSSSSFPFSKLNIRRLKV